MAMVTPVEKRVPAVGLTRRSVLAALAAVVAMGVLTPVVEIALGGTQIGSFAPPGAPVLLLILFCVPLPLLGRATARLGWKPFSRAERLTVYIALLAGSVLASCQFAQWVIPVVTGPFYYGNPENKWAELTAYMPAWWGPRDPEVIRRFYEGLKEGQGIPWAAWMAPLLSWGSFVLAFCCALLCISELLRAQWIDSERLTFPLAQLPLEMTADPAAFWRQRLLWGGVAIPAFVHLVNGVAYHAVGAPAINLREISLMPYFPDRPWNAVRPMFFSIYFCLIGFAFLTSRDVPLSMVFFWALFKLELVAGTAVGWTLGGEDRSLRGTSFPLVEAQLVGAILTLVAINLRFAWPHMCRVWGAVRARTDTESAWAVRGLAPALLFLSIWLFAAGLPWWLALLFPPLAILFILGAYRMMAEGGVNFFWASQSGPNYLLFSFDGGTSLGTRAWLILLALPYFTWFFKGPVGPQALEGFKLGDVAGLSPRRLAPLLVASMALSMAVAYIAVLWMAHTRGGGVVLDGFRFIHVGQRPFQELQSVVGANAGFSLEKSAGMLLAALFTLFLGAMRIRYLWWRLHPLGYAASLMASTDYMWFSLLLGSSANWGLTKWGGFRAYRQARPFFLGLILGEFLMLGFWMIIDALTGVRGFRLFGI